VSRCIAWRLITLNTLMKDTFDSTDRRGADFILFALGFFGFVVAAAGIVIGSPSTALFGGLLALFAVSVFQLRPSPEH
jgi:hypothetical protein